MLLVSREGGVRRAGVRVKTEVSATRALICIALVARGAGDLRIGCEWGCSGAGDLRSPLV
jgi:hypothetical protein